MNELDEKLEELRAYAYKGFPVSRETVEWALETIASLVNNIELLKQITQSGHNDISGNH